MDRYFEFDNQKSIDMGFHIITFKDEDFTRLTYGGREIITSYNLTADTKETPLEIEFMLTKMNGDDLVPFDRYDINKLAAWLMHDSFKELRFSNDIDKVYKVMLKDIEPLTLDRIENGYVRVRFQSYSSHAYTNIRTDSVFVDGERDYEIVADFTIGKQYNPIIRIDAIEDTDVEIFNMATGDNFILKDIKQGEFIEVDNDLKLMDSSELNSNPFKNFNRKWLGYRRGSNLLQIKGKANIEFVAQYPIL